MTVRQARDSARPPPPSRRRDRWTLAATVSMLRIADCSEGSFYAKRPADGMSLDDDEPFDKLMGRCPLKMPPAGAP